MLTLRLPRVAAEKTYSLRRVRGHVLSRANRGSISQVHRWNKEPAGQGANPAAPTVGGSDRRTLILLTAWDHAAEALAGTQLVN